MKKTSTNTIPGDCGQPQAPSRRAALRKLGLFGLMAYAAPAIASISEAQACHKGARRPHSAKSVKSKARPAHATAPKSKGEHHAAHPAHAPKKSARAHSKSDRHHAKA